MEQNLLSVWPRNSFPISQGKYYINYGKFDNGNLG